MVEGLFRTGGAERDDFELVTNGRKHELCKKQAIIRIVFKYVDTDNLVDVFNDVFKDVFKDVFEDVFEDVVESVFSDRRRKFLYLVL